MIEDLSCKSEVLYFSLCDKLHSHWARTKSYAARRALTTLHRSNPDFACTTEQARMLLKQAGIV